MRLGTRSGRIRFNGVPGQAMEQVKGEGRPEPRGSAGLAAGRSERSGAGPRDLESPVGHMRGEWGAPVAPATRRAEREQARAAVGPRGFWMPGGLSPRRPPSVAANLEGPGDRSPAQPSGDTASACAWERGPRDYAREAGADSVTESP